MFRNLLDFEWHYYTRKPLFYITTTFFAGMGFLAGSTGSISFPNVNKNSPYDITFLIGLLSLAAIFSITFSVAQNFLRESESKFDTIIYTTPVNKFTYLFSRLAAIFGIAALSFMTGVAFLYAGHQLSSLPPDKFGTYSVMNYLWPFIVLAVPNIILCVALLCSTAWVTRNKLTIYVTGLFIYVVYIVASIFANSPLIAGSTPASPEKMSLFAKLDPLGIAAFLEQTRYWTAHVRNTQHIALSGNLLFNRILWLSISMIILTISYLKFSFRNVHTQGTKKIKRSLKTARQATPYKPVSTNLHTPLHNYTSLLSFIKIDLISIIKGIPFICIFILWTALLGIEMYNSIDGNPRSGESFATTGLMVSTVIETLPFFALLVILFYSNELLWRSRAVHFDALENTTPANSVIVLISKLIALSVIPIFMVVHSCILGIFFQAIKGFPVIDFPLYASLLYYLAFPLMLCVVLAAAIQILTKNRYTGLALAGAIVILSCTNIGRIIGITHPLFRYANTFSITYADLNGFGNYVTAFHWLMLFWSCIAICLIIITSSIWNSSRFKMNYKHWIVLIVASITAMLSGGYIFYQTNIRNSYQTPAEINDWKQEYEKRFQAYENFPEPTITAVKTKVDLHPSAQRYEVEGKYQLVNNSSKSIDSLLIYIDREIELKTMAIENARLIKNESAFGHYWYIFEKPLQPKETATMNFTFSSEWSPFRSHTPFNSIIDNGSFIRISNYYPSFGYEGANEITNSLERKKRAMKPQQELTKLETPLPSPYDYQFIDLDAIVSTEGDQIAIGSGDLINKWTKNNRNYFHYKTASPIRFRFAFSSARYTIQKDTYKHIPIEVYYDERHSANVEQLIADIKKTMDYCERNFGSYPHKVIRFAEISAFAEGFAATAYPGTIYMKENGGFYQNLSAAKQQDVINQLAGHELSHQWWGTSQIDPEYKEGGWILTETLAKYTELMMYKNAHGLDAVLKTVGMHTDLYLSNRSFSKEMPLYKTSYETPHLPYDKGLIVMYQLIQLIGESSVNAALRSLLSNHAFPKTPPSSLDLLNEFYKVAPKESHSKIDELFKEIIIYDSKIDEVICTQVSNNNFEIEFKATSLKYREDGYGKRSAATPDKFVEIGIYSGDKELKVEAFEVVKDQVVGKIMVREKPEHIVIDPKLKTIDSFLEDNEKAIEVSLEVNHKE